MRSFYLLPKLQKIFENQAAIRQIQKNLHLRSTCTTFAPKFRKKCIDESI